MADNTGGPPEPDARVLDALRQVLGPDPVPQGLVARAAALITLADMDADLAELLDSTAAEPAGVRGGGSGDSLTFQLGDGSVTIDVALGPDGLSGHVLPAVAGAITLQRPGQQVDAVLDPLGRFAFAQPPPGPARLAVEDGGRVIRTDWFVI